MVSQRYPKPFFGPFNSSLPFANKRVTLTYTPDFVHLRNDTNVMQGGFG